MTLRGFADLESYLRRHFSESDLTNYAWPISHAVHVRYELGDRLPNGSDARLEQVNARATAVLEDCFQPQAELLLLINESLVPDGMFPSATPEYLDQLLGGQMGQGEERLQAERGDDEDGDAFAFRQRVVPARLGGIPYREILAGIAHFEQGREPSIGQRVFFIAPESDIVFHMYDDRGCIVFSDQPAKLVHLYRKYNAWLVDFHRRRMDALFEGLA